MREHDALRTGAGSTRVKDFRHRVLVKLHQITTVRSGRDEHLFVSLSGKPLRLRCSIEWMERTHGLQIPPERIHKTNKLLLQEQYRRSRIIQNVGKLRPCQAIVERKQNAARLQNSEVGFQQPMAV